MPDILTQQDGPILRVTLNQPDARQCGVRRDGRRARRHHRRRGENFEPRRAARRRQRLLRRPRHDGRRAASRIPTRYERRAFSDVVFNCYGAMRDAKVPIIAVVQGRALGFGCAIAAACDITLASDAAVFQVPEMAHNILPTMVMSSFVDRVPRKAMSYLVYSQAEIGPERALSFGIVSDVVPAAELDAAVETLCAAILKAPQPAIHGVKEYVKTATRHGGLRRRRIRPQSARHRQFLGRDAQKALTDGSDAKRRTPRIRLAGGLRKG